MNVTAPSDEVDAKIREQIEACAFPAPLKAEDRDCGDIAWLLDVIAPTKEQATTVVKNFGQMVKDGKLFVHPGVRRSFEEVVFGQGAPCRRRVPDLAITRGSGAPPAVNDND